MDLIAIQSWILLASTVVLALVGIVSLYYNQKLISEMIFERKYNLKPFVICNVISKRIDGHLLLYIVVHNQGKGPAKNIKLRLTSDLMVLKNKKEFQTEIHLLGSDGRTEISMGLLSSTDDREINAELDYCDIFSESIHDEHKLSLSSVFRY